MTAQQETVDVDQVFSDFVSDAQPTFPDLASKHVFITGGGSGIGAYFSAAFALQGAKVSFVSLNHGPAEFVCSMIAERTKVRPEFIQCDIRDVERLHRAMQKAESVNGPIDILINNAARDTRHTVDTLKVDEWDDALNTNLRPHFFAIQMAAKSMRQTGSGAIINVGSNSANLGLAGYPAYVTSKAAIIGLTKAVARELGEDGIRVNTLVPGWVMTERQKRLWVTEEAMAACLAEQSIKRAMNGWDIANFALFLASSTSGMLTGQEIIVDGGRV